MTKLNETTLNLIDEYVSLQKELNEFEEEIKTQEGNLKGLQAEQAKKFTFDRANMINTLTMSIEQAKRALLVRREEKRKVIEGNKLAFAVRDNVKKILSDDDELLTIQLQVKSNIEAILADVKEYRELYKFKRDTLTAEVKAMSDINLYTAIQYAKQLSEFEPFSNRQLENALDKYANPEKYNRV